MRTRYREQGFTLTELMTVVAILGILVALAIPTYRGLTRRATDAVLVENTRTLETLIRLLVQEDAYDLRFRTNPNRDSADVFLSRRLQEDLEADDITVADTTLEPIENPVSGNDNVLLRGSPNTNRFPTPPGVFITGSNRYRHEQIRQNPGRLAGSIVIMIDRRRDRVEIYYMNQDGVPSEELSVVEVVE